MKSKNIKTKAKKIPDKKPKVAAKKANKTPAKKQAKAPVKVAKVKDTPKGQNKNKKFFPKDAKTASPKKVSRPAKAAKVSQPATPVAAAEPPKTTARRAPWSKKPVENIHSTPANAGYSMRSEFDKYIAKKYKKLKDDQIKSLWITVSSQMLAEPGLKLLDVVDNCLTKK